MAVSKLKAVEKSRVNLSGLQIESFAVSPLNLKLQTYKFVSPETLSQKLSSPFAP